MNMRVRPSESEAGVALIGEPSFADAIAAIEAAENLSPDHKRYWTTSLRQTARYLDQPLAGLPARITAIGAAVKKLHPERLGVNAKTFVNHRANTRTALLWFNRTTLGTGRGAPMAPAYRALLRKIDDRHVRDVLSPFLRYLTGFAVTGDEVDDRHVEAFLAWRRETAFSNVKKGHHRRLVRCWNRCAKSIHGWPAAKLAEPAPAKRLTGPGWEDFPEGLRTGIEAHCAALTRRRKAADGRTLWPSAPSTIATRRRELVAVVRAAVEAGIRLDDLNSLGELLRPDRVEIIIDHYWKRNGDTPGSYTIGLASKLLTIAKTELNFTIGDLERLNEIRLSVERFRKKGLTDKNRTLVRQVIQGGVWRSVAQLPQRLLAEARSGRRTMPVRAAVTAQLAVAIRILTIAPVRIGNLASIRLDANLVRPGGPETHYTLIFPDYDVKNRLPLEFPLDGITTEMIDEYLHDHRPQLMRGRNHDSLFPGAGGPQKLTRGLGEQISAVLWKVLGLKITPHQFRHAAAAIILIHEPGNYELVRRVLGHRNLQTTINFYVGLETIAAARRFGEIVAAALPTSFESSRGAGS